MVDIAVMAENATDEPMTAVEMAIEMAATRKAAWRGMRWVDVSFRKYREKGKTLSRDMA